MTTLHEEFVSRVREELPGQWQALTEAIAHGEPTVSVRINTRRGATVPDAAQRVPWCHTGIYLMGRPAFTFDPDMHSGLYYVQDASSMFLHHVLRTLVSSPVRYLDLCAAPGGKTTVALDALPPGSLVVANEIVPQRARALCDNVVRWGNANVVVTNSSPAACGAMADTFDVVAADVPCSGEGMMRKDAQAVAQWTPTLVEECAQRQRAIIADVWPALRPGGLLIYSTCTYARAENELMVEHLVNHYGAEPVMVPVDAQWGIASAAGSALPCYRFMPHLVRGEGLFMAVLRKPGNALAAPPRTARRPTGKTVVPPQATEWLATPHDFVMTMVGDTIVAVPRRWATLAEALRSNLTVIYCGIEVGNIKGRNLVPAHSLALSTELNHTAFASCNIDYPTAMSYLRGEAITIEAPKGYTLVTHRGAPLGWVNNLGTRANNLYPRGMRILSTHTPPSAPMVLREE